MKKLSIIIASYNTRDITLEAVRSIIDSKPKSDFEIIIVDDGSVDGSIEVLQQLAKSNKKIKVLFNKQNLGYVRTNNRGIKKTKGRYILLLNSDTIVKEKALDNLIEFAEKHDDAGVIGSRLFNIDNSLQPSCYHFPTIKNAILEYLLGKKGLFEKYAPRGNLPSKVDAVVGAAFLITPQALKKVGMLNEKYRSYFEDIDYCRSVWKKGLKVYYLPTSEIIHHEGASFKKLAGEKDRWKKLIPSSKIYHGIIKHCIINFIIWSGQKCEKFLSKK